MAIYLNDLTSNGNNLTNNGASEETTSLPFAASTIAVNLETSEEDSLSAADSSSLSLTSDFTLELWLNLESQPASNIRMGIIGKWLTAGNQGSYILEYGDVAGVKRLTLFLSNDGVNADELYIAYSLATATWTHLALTWKASSATAKFYINGSQAGTDQVGSRTSIYNSSASFYIGRRRNDTLDGTESTFDGLIDEVRVWNTVRTQTEINNNKSNELVGNETGLVAYWAFESTVATTTSTSTSITTSTSTTSTSSSTSTTSTSTSTTTTSTSTSTTSTSTTSTSSTTTWPYDFSVDQPDFGLMRLDIDRIQ